MFDKTSFVRGKTLAVGVSAGSRIDGVFLVLRVYTVRGISPTKTTAEIDGHVYQ